MDLLKKIYYKEISIDYAYEFYEKIQEDFKDGKSINGTVNLGEKLKMDKYEFTAFCQSAPLEVIADWRYNGWPDICCESKMRFNYKDFGWIVTELEDGSYGLTLLK